MHISLILINYNTKSDTDECLKSLSVLKTKGFSYNVVVVDNGSMESYSLPRTLTSNKKFEVVRSEANLGFTGGNNLGIYYAIEKYNSDYTLLLNNDTVVEPHFLQKLIDCSEDHSEYGLICPKIYFYKGNEYHKKSYSRSQLGSVLWYAGGSIDWPNLAAFHRGVDEVDRGQFDTFSDSDFATGCCVLIKREVLEKVGTFDKRYFLYFEDVDLSVRAHDARYGIGFCPEAVVWHKNAGSSGGAGSSVHNYYIARNRLLFAFKHGGNKSKLVGLRVLLQYLLSGTNYQKTAVLHFLFRRFGKQPIV